MNQGLSWLVKKQQSLRSARIKDGLITYNFCVFDLLDALQKLYERQKLSKPINTKITKKELSVKERVVKIRNILRERKKVKFIELFDDLSKPYVVVTFLSVLEMTKNGEIILKQDNNFSDIYLESVDK